MNALGTKRLLQESLEAPSTTVVRLTDRADNSVLAYGDTVPSAVAGYNIGSLFFDTTNAVLYLNTGTASSCTFTAVVTTAGATTGTITLGSGGDLIFSGTTGQNEITFTDNLADALSVKITGGADYLVFDSTNSDEKLTVLSAVTQKLGFWGTTPVVQPAGAAQGALGSVTTAGSNTGTAAAGLSLIGATNSTDASADIMNDFRALQEDISALFTLVAALRTALVNTGIIKGAA